MIIARLQAHLNAKGYDAGPADGLLGPHTITALCELITQRGAMSRGAAVALWQGMYAQGITTPDRINNFLANCGAESGFKIAEERLSYSTARLMEVWPSRFPTEVSTLGYAGRPQALANKVYGGRMGNTEPDDGWAYRGRGWAQLTGRDAYKIVGALVRMDFEHNPDLVLTPIGCALSATGFWTWKNLAVHADLNDPMTLRQRWNGGLTGWPAVAAALAKLEDAWG